MRTVIIDALRAIVFGVLALVLAFHEKPEIGLSLAMMFLSGNYAAFAFMEHLESKGR